MFRRLSLVATLAFVAAFAIVAPAAAQGGLTYSSSIQVQNLSANTATIQITFYDEATGNASSTVVNDTIAANSNKSYFPLPSGLGTFKGSAVVSSDQPVAAITNLLGGDGAYAGSATGLSGGATTVGLPLIMRANTGFSTFLSVQNTGTADANITITYTPGSKGTAATQTGTIKPGAAKQFDQATLTALGDVFIGSATVTSNQPVAVMVGQLGTGSFKTLLMYDGFNGGSTTVRAPLVMANNSGFISSLNIQNVGSASTTVTVNYSTNLGGSFAPASQTLTLAPGQGGNLLQAAGQWGTNKYIGSATITASQPLVVVVNQLKLTGGSAGTAYEGFNPASLTSKASAPLLMAGNGGYFTTLQCQNAGTAATTITVTYSANTVSGLSGTPAPDTVTVEPGANATIFQAQAANAKWSGRYVGSATVTASGNQPIACLVNQLNNSVTTDAFLTYNAINY